MPEISTNEHAQMTMGQASNGDTSAKIIQGSITRGGAERLRAKIAQLNPVSTAIALKALADVEAEADRQ